MPISVRVPDGRTIKVQAESPQEAAKAARLFIARERMDKSRPKNKFEDEATRAATFGLSAPVNAGIGALVDQITGGSKLYSLGEGFTAARQLEKDRSDQYQRDKPVRGLLASLTGGFVAPGGQQISNFIGKGGNLLSQTARAALAGGGAGGVYGASTADPGGELQGAKSGAVTGAITGGAVPIVGRVASTAAQSAPVKTIVRAANRASGGKLLDAKSEAGKRLVEALKADGADQNTIRTVMNDWVKTGASSPALIDVASQLPSGGQKTIALLRGSALKAGPGRGAAMEYRKQVEADLQPNVIRRTRDLVPENRSAQELTDELTQSRGRLATEQYAEPYAQPVELSNDTVSAISGAPGRAALQRARSAAEARMDTEQMAEIDALLRGDTDQVSAATLDRIKIAMRERADKAARTGANDLRSGLARRTGMIDDSLENVPGLQDARSTYSNLTNQIDAIPEGAGVVNAMPDEFAATVAKRISAARPVGEEVSLEQVQDAIRQASRLGGARELEGVLGRPTENATGAINRISSSTNTGRNLSTLFGDEEAQSYQQALANEVKRLENARSIDPGQNSRTALNLEDAGNIQKPTIGNMVSGIIQKIRNGATLTDEEAEVLVKLGTSQANPDIVPMQAPKQLVSPAFAVPASIATQR